MIVKKYMTALALSSGIFLCAMDKSNLNLVRDQIDESMLGVKVDSWGRSFTGSWASWKKSWSLDDRIAINDLQQVESFVPTGCDKKEFYEKLVQNHWYFYALVQQAVQKETKALDAVSGSTIDKLLDPDRTIVNLSAAMSSFVKQKATPELFTRIDYRLADQRIFFDDSDIHLTPLFAKEYVNVGDGNLVTSPDGKYARSIDDGGNNVVWNLESGCSVNINDQDIAWERIRSWEAYDEHAVIDGIDEHAIFTNVRIHTLLSSFPRHISFAKESEKGGYLMVLFKRPTKESRLCNAAFKNSRGNRDELLQLLNSRTLKKIEGFPAENLRFLINKELDGLQQAKL